MPDTSPRPYDYAAFIQELREHIAAADSLRHADTMEFREWHHALLDSIKKIRALKYTVNTDVVTRNFEIHSEWDRISASDQMAFFDDALSTTMSELKLIVRNFERYGDPKASSDAPSAADYAGVVAERDAWKKKAEAISNASDTEMPRQPLPAPEKVTVVWLLHNVPVGLFSAGVAVAVAALIGAFTLGGSKLGRAWVDAISPAEAASASGAPARNATP